mmetsp:Transcript_54688/g.122784  ORF Transcript_54688/g.122784 Transcript_54688/m.122784 type:complete len:806 (+) Transcript_54688:101-2518(+)
MAELYGKVTGGTAAGQSQSEGGATAGDRLSQAYSSKAAAAGESAGGREAAMVFAVAEGHLAAGPREADDALKAAEDALSKFRALKDDQGVADCIRVIIHVRRHRCQLAEAEQLARTELEKFVSAGSRLAAAKMRLALAEILTFSGTIGGPDQFDEAQQQAEDALAVSKEEADLSVQGLAMLALANLLIMKADPVSGKAAMEHALAAVDFYKSQQDKRGEAQAWHCLAVARDSAGEAEASGAMDATLEALSLFRELKAHHSLALELQSVARRYLRRRRPADALAFAKEAAEIARDLDLGRSEEAAIVEVLASSHLELGEIELAESVASETLQRCRDAEDLQAVAKMLEVLMFVHLFSNNVGAATSSAQEAKAVAKQLGDSEKEMRILQILASLALHQKELPGAVSNAKDAAGLCPQADPPFEAMVGVQIAAKQATEATEEAKVRRTAMAAHGQSEVSALLAQCSSNLACGEFQSALDAAAEAKRQTASRSNPADTAKVLRRLARVYIEMKVFVQASIELREAIQLLDTPDCVDKPGLVVTLLLAAEAQTNEVMSQLDSSRQETEAVFKSQRFVSSYVQAQSLARRAITLARDLEDSQLLAAGLMFGGRLSISAMRIGDALEFVREALSHFRAACNVHGEIEALALRANIHLLGNRPEKATAIAKEALLLSLQCGDEKGEAMCATVLERISIYRPGNPEENLALEIAKTVRPASTFLTDDLTEGVSAGHSEAILGQTRKLSQEIVRSVIVRVGAHVSQELPTVYSSGSTKYFADGFSRKLPTLSGPSPTLAADPTVLAAAAYIRNRR